MSRWVVLFLLLGACAGSRAMAPDLSLHDRFVLTVLTNDDGSPARRLYRWSVPMMLRYDGPEEYRTHVEHQLIELGEIAGKPVDLNPRHPNFFVEISDRDTPSTCRAEVQFGRAEIHIWSELRPDHIRQCIAQEMTQAIGPGGDLDGPFGSRQDTVFASYGGALELTKSDRQVLRILFDPRLRSGMRRDDVLEVLPQIVAEMDAEQEATR